MAIIYSYPSVTPVVADILLITQASDPSKATKSVTLSSVKTLFGLNDSLSGVGTPGYIPFFETDSRLVDSFISQDANGLVFIGSQASGTRFTNTSVSSPTLTGTDLYATNIYGNNSGLLNIQGNAIIGNEATDTLTVNSISTFNADVTVLGNTILGEDDSTEVTIESTLSLQGPVKDSGSNLGGDQQVLVSNASGNVAWGAYTTGTVKSVGITETGNALTITNTPITSSGDINIAGAGNNTQVILGDLTLGSYTQGTVKGTGTVNFVPKWSAADTLQDSIIFDDGTNVGIGVSGINPEDKLHVMGTVRSVISTGSGFGFLTNRGSNGSASGIRWDNNNSSLILKDSTDVITTKISSNGFSWFNGGSVGFGTKTPAAPVEMVVNDASGKGLLLSNVGDGSAYDSVRVTYSGYGTGSPECIFRPKTQPGTGIVNTYFRFKTNGTAASGNIANVTIDGKVGIGTTNDVIASQLTVGQGDIEITKFATGLILRSNNGTRYRITVANDGTLTTTAV